MEGGQHLLTVLCDVNTEWLHKHSTTTFQHCIDSLLVFCNSYLMLSHTNKIAFIAYNAHQVKFVYPNTTDTTTNASAENSETALSDGKFDMFSGFNDTVQEQVKTMISHAAADNTLPPKSPSLLAGALSKGLCYIHNIDRNMIGQKTQSRILILKCSPDGSLHYMSIMNSIFAAQKANITIDGCDIEGKSGFLQQASSITGGTYFVIENLSGLLEYLLWMFLPDPELRTKLNLPKSEDIDYRAVCFCHKKFVDVGFICSVCLSIYCKFVPKCQTCQTRFKMPQLSMSLKGKKKKKETKKAVT